MLYSFRADFLLISEYMAKAYYHNLPTVLCKILGIYTVRYDNKETGKKVNSLRKYLINLQYLNSMLGVILVERECCGDGEYLLPTQHYSHLRPEGF